MDAPHEPTNEEAVAALYRELLASWNRRVAAAFAALFADDGVSIGFDGSAMTGPAEIGATLSQIFADHATAAYIYKIRGIRMLAPDVALLLAVVGMVPPGKDDINPAVNALQTVVAVRRGEQWRIAQLQNTPAQYHGRPAVAEALSQELRELL